MFFCIKSIISTFGTTVNGVFYGVIPMGGENNWICIFEADLGCMVTFYIKSASFGAHFLRLYYASMEMKMRPRMESHFLYLEV